MQSRISRSTSWYRCCYWRCCCWYL